MAINKNWTRWLVSSVAKHFDALRGTLPMFMEGQDRTRLTSSRLIELRFDGPFIKEESKNYYSLEVDVNVLVQNGIDDDDFYTIYTDTGIVSAAFTQTIPVYKYGNTADDDDSLLSCLYLVPHGRGKDTVMIQHFGQIEPKTRLLQSTVEGQYMMYLSL